MPTKPASPLTETLIAIGLTSEQTRLYLTLLEHGPQSAATLAKLTGAKRTNIYHLANQLATIQLVTSRRQGKSTIFSPLSPDHLIAQAKQRLLSSEQAARTLEDLLPQLKDMYSHQETRPTITYYEGREGLKKIFREIYAPKTEPLLGCADLDKVEAAIPQFLEGEHIPNRIKNAVKAVALLSDSALTRRLHKTDLQDLRESHLVKRSHYPLPAEIDVFEDKIAMLSFEQDRFVGLIIQNQAIATSLKSVFRLAFIKS